MGAKNRRFSDSFFSQHKIDAHEVKSDYGCHPVSHYDIYNGKTVTIESKDNSVVIDTEMSMQQFIDCYENTLRRTR